MKQRGQVFSVDFLISIMVIVLAIGLLLVVLGWLLILIANGTINFG